MPEGVPPRGRGPHRLRRVDGGRRGDQDRGGAAGIDVAIIGLGGVGLSCVMGAVLAGAWRIVAVDANPAKLALARELGATHAVLADPADPAATVAAIQRRGGDGGPDYAFEAIGLPPRSAQAVECAAAGRDGGARRHDAVRRARVVRGFPFVDGARRIIGSNYGSAVAADRLPAVRRAGTSRAGCPIDRLIDRRLPLADLEDAFDRLRAGQAARQVVVFGTPPRLRRASCGRPAARRPRRGRSPSIDLFDPQLEHDAVVDRERPRGGRASRSSGLDDRRAAAEQRTRSAPPGPGGSGARSGRPREGRASLADPASATVSRWPSMKPT